MVRLMHGPSRWLVLLGLLLPVAAAGQAAPHHAGPGHKDRGFLVVVPVHVIPIGRVIAPDDVTIGRTQYPPAADAVRATQGIVGQEARRRLYPGRMIQARDVGPVTLVQRNARVTIRFRKGPIELTTVGRALEPGGEGQVIRVMNLESRRTLYGRVIDAEVVDVGS